ncbi:MAG: hypothetical protein AB7P21_30270 [Lautropia sp.]
MNHAVRISEAEMVELRRAAELNNRSIAGQAEYWMRLGRAAERNPEMTMSRIEAALRGLAPVDPGALDDDEFDQLMTGIGKTPPSADARAFYQRMNEQGIGVGMDDDGNLVFGDNEPL